MTKTTKASAVIDIPDVNYAFVGNTLRPFTKDEFVKIKMILAKKRRRNTKVTITDRDLRAAGLEHLIADSGNGNDYLKLQERLLNGQNADQLYRAAKQRWQKRKRQK
jgi:hypothetical protein